MREFRGHLYIFVDRTKNDADGPAAAAFDDVFGLCEPGQLRWYLSGWAIGKSAQSRYCSRTSLAKARRFGTFAEAMDFARKKRRTRPDECFHLVYELDGQKAIVKSLDQILRIDGDPLSTGQHAAATDNPVMEQIASRTGKIVATNALALHGIFQREGEEAARARFSGATFDRLWRVLQEAGLVEKLSIAPPQIAPLAEPNQ